MVNLKNLFVKFLCVLYVCVEVTSYTVYFLQLFALFFKKLTVLDICDFFPLLSVQKICVLISHD